MRGPIIASVSCQDAAFADGQPQAGEVSVPTNEVRPLPWGRRLVERRWGFCLTMTTRRPPAP